MKELVLSVALVLRFAPTKFTEVWTEKTEQIIFCL